MSQDRNTSYWEKNWLTPNSNLRQRCLIVLSTMFGFGIDKSTIAKQMRAVQIPGRDKGLSIRQDRIDEFHGFLKGSKPRQTHGKEERKKHQEFGWEFGYALLNASPKILHTNPKKTAKDRHEDLKSLPKIRGTVSGTVEEQELKFLKLNRSIIDHIGTVHSQTMQRSVSIPEYIWTGVALYVYRDMEMLVKAVAEEYERGPQTFDIDTFLDSFNVQRYASDKADALFYKRPSKK